METSRIWARSFGKESSNRSVERLVVSLRVARERIKLITDRISSTLPGLTLHDVTHMDALWEVADVIAGDEFKLNPLEAYVFGCAVLFHDSCLCFEAYEGGQAAVRETVEWRDIQRRLELLQELSNIDEEADFATLRALHAKQSARLAVQEWKGDGDTYVIDDSELREHYGYLIGKIAESHHWEIERVVTEFKHSRPTAPFLPEDWPVDALKIACLLRVADAGHIDGRRAPTFLLKILEMNSLSRDHWVAQNHLGRIMVNRDDPESLVVSSTKPFTRFDSKAWWVAFDAVNLLNKELENCNEVLVAHNRQKFKHTRVTGAGSVPKLKKFIETQGWEPTNSSVHVSDVAALVSNLGGKSLYGKDCDRLEIALRELIQNATDAILARRKIEGTYGPGQVVIRLNKEQGTYVLQVDDDGIGMSKNTMSKNLLDFGKSFWLSEDVLEELPGLLLKNYSPIGQFGIGFFSIFMAAKQVKVFSRRYDSSLDEFRCLSFQHGISLRPVMSQEHPFDIGMNISTRVEIVLDVGVLDDPGCVPIRGQEKFNVLLSEYVASMVCGLNMPIKVEVSGIEKLNHTGFPPPSDRRKQWLKTISYESSRANPNLLSLIDEATPRLSEIRDENMTYGLAAISVSDLSSDSFLTLKSVGGLSTPHHSQHSGPFIGLIDHFPENARRNPGDMIAPKSALQSWLEEQVKLLDDKGASELERIHASYTFCEFEYNPKSVLTGVLVFNHRQEVEFWRLEELGNKLDCGSILVFPSVVPSTRHLDSHAYLRGMHQTQPNVYRCIVVRNGKFNYAEIDGNNTPGNPNSLIGVVHRTLEELNRNPTWHVHENVYTSLVGSGDYLEVRIK